MFERFSHQAREAVIAAQQIAREASSRTIDTRHILLALTQAPGAAAAALGSVGVDVERLATELRSELAAAGLDATALASLGIDLSEVRARTDAVFGGGALDRAKYVRGHLPFTRDAKKALELALRETIRLQHRTIDGRHLLLGILRAECPGRVALTDRGVDVGSLRQELDTREGPASRSA